MVLDNIEQLLEKYDNGETTLQEEQQLKHYFSQETVAPHLEAYQTMFQYFSHNQTEEFTKTIPLKPRKTNIMYKWISVAAVAVLMFGLYTQIQSKNLTYADLSDEDKLAYNQTIEALNLLSSKFNKGAQSMNTLGFMSTSLNQGIENMSYLGEFSNATNRILKNNN